MDEPYIVIDYKIQNNVVERHVITYNKSTDTILDDYAKYTYTYNEIQHNIYSETHFIVEYAVQNILKCLPSIHMPSYTDTIDICDTDSYINTIGVFQIPYNEYHEWIGYIHINNTIIYSISAQLNMSTYNYVYNSLKQLLYMLIRA